MKILVLAKHVPESTATIKVKDDGSGTEAAGVKFILNPFDEFAVELALQTKEKHPSAGVETIVLTVGPPEAADAIRTALAMGIEQAIHIALDDLTAWDELCIARMIAAAVKDRGFDLILAGKIAIDYDSGQVGPALAEVLGWPHVGAIHGLQWADDLKKATVKRRIEGAEEVVEVTLPAVWTIEKGLVEPRYPSLPGLMKAKRKPVEQIAANSLGSFAPATRMTQFAPPPPRPPGRMIEGDPAEAAKELVRILHEEEKVF
jgi:electron transfer flavoprotein beta subunit